MHVFDDLIKATLGVSLSLLCHLFCVQSILLEHDARVSNDYMFSLGYIPVIEFGNTQTSSLMKHRARLIASLSPN